MFLKSHILRAVLIGIICVMGTGFVRSLGQDVDRLGYNAQSGIAYQSAMEAYGLKRYAEAHEIFFALAQRGHADAKAMLGVMYFHGLGVTQDKPASAVWFYQAAESGRPGAQLVLAQMYFNGDGVGQSTQDAAFWLELSMSRSDDTLRAQSVALRGAIDRSGLPGGWAAIRQRVDYWRPIMSERNTYG